MHLKNLCVKAHELRPGDLVYYGEGFEWVVRIEDTKEFPADANVIKVITVRQGQPSFFYCGRMSDQHVGTYRVSDFDVVLFGRCGNPPDLTDEQTGEFWSVVMEEVQLGLNTIRDRLVEKYGADVDLYWES